MDELAETEGFATDADAGFEALETVRKRKGFGKSGGGEDDLGGVPGDFQELVDAVSLCEVSFEVIEEVSLFLGRGGGSFGSHGGASGGKFLFPPN